MHQCSIDYGVAGIIFPGYRCTAKSWHCE